MSAIPEETKEHWESPNGRWTRPQSREATSSRRKSNKTVPRQWDEENIDISCSGANLIPSAKQNGIYSDDMAVIPQPKDSADDIKCITTASIQQDLNVKLESAFGTILIDTFEKYKMPIDHEEALDSLMRMGMQDYMWSICDFYYLLDDSNSYFVKIHHQQQRGSRKVTLDMGDYPIETFLKKKKTFINAQIPNEANENLIVRQKECGASYRLNFA